MLEGIAKELSEKKGKVLRFYVEGGSPLEREPIKVDEVTQYTVTGYTQRQVIVSDGNRTVAGTDEAGIRARYIVSDEVTANGARTTLRLDKIHGWAETEPSDASTDKMPYVEDLKSEKLNRYP